jgi:hypothetical protein
MVSSGPWKARGMASGSSWTEELAGETAIVLVISSRKRVFIVVMVQVSAGLRFKGTEPIRRVENP